MFRVCHYSWHTLFVYANVVYSYAHGVVTLVVGFHLVIILHRLQSFVKLATMAKKTSDASRTRGSRVHLIFMKYNR